MNSLNSIIMEGNLTRDVEMKYLQSGVAVASFDIAVNRSFKKGDGWEEEVSFFRIEAWGKLAESCNEYISKGRGVRVVGRLKQDRWEDEGKTRSSVKIIAEHVEFKPKPKDEAEPPKSSKPAQRQPAKQQPAADPDDFSDDIPF